MSHFSARNFLYYGAYKNLRINKNDRILVRGATSGVGVVFAKLVKASIPNVAVDGTSRVASKGNQLKKVGFDEVIIDENGVLQTDKSYSKILELVGPKTIKNSLTHLEEFSVICSCGQLGDQWYLEHFDPIEELKKNVYLTTFYSGNVSQSNLQEMLDFIENFRVETSPQKVFKLEEIKSAHRYLESSSSFGKVIVKV